MRKVKEKYVRKYKFQDRAFSEFILQWCSNISMEEMKMLSSVELFNIQPDNISKWVSESTLDDKLLMLSKTGGQFFLVAGSENGWKAINSKKSIFQQYFRQGRNREIIIDELVKEKVFVLASQQMIIASYYMHQNCQSDYYRLNPDFLRLYNLWELTKGDLGKNRTGSNFNSGSQLQRIETANNLITDFAFHILRNQGFFANLGLGVPTDLLILVHLMQKNNRTDNKTKFSEMATIYNACNDGTFAPNGFGRRLTWLAQNGYVNKMAVEKRPRYAISDRGAQVVMMYTQKLAELVKFDLQ